MGLIVVLVSFLQDDAIGTERRLAKIIDGVTPVCFAVSSDAKSTAYVAKKLGKFVVVVEGKPGEAFDAIKGTPALSRDGRVVAFPARNGKAWTLIVNGEKWDSYDYVSNPAVSPDGKHAACVAEISAGAKDFVVVDKVKGEDFDHVGIPIFKPDGKTVVYGADRSGTCYLVEGQKKTVYPYFLQEIVLDSKGNLVGGTTNFDNKCHAVFRGTPCPEYQNASAPTLSADGKTMAYVAIKGVMKNMVVVGNQEGPIYGSVGRPVLSHDGRQVAYRAWDQGKFSIVVGQYTGEGVRDQSDPVFNRDDTCVGFGVLERDEILWKVLKFPVARH